VSASEVTDFGRDYGSRLATVVDKLDWDAAACLAEALMECWSEGRQFFICGNGGSAANANHLANDLLYGIAKSDGPGLRVSALSANVSVLTCLANDEGYDSVYALQLAVQAREGDVLLTLSGSGNSPNILRVLEEAQSMGVTSFAILGFDGGAAKRLADHAVHVPVDDMQIAEDTQLIIGHMVMQWLYLHRSEVIHTQ